MRWLLGAAVSLAVLAALALVAAVLLLPAVLRSEGTRARIQSGAEAALGRAFRYQSLEFWPLPPSLVVVAPAIAGAAPQAAEGGAQRAEGERRRAPAEPPPLAEARRVSLRVALLPLLARELLIDGVVVDGATVRLRRSAKGIELPSKPPQAARSEPKASEGGPPQEAETQQPPPFAVRRLTLRDTTLILEDEAAQPSVTWELRDLDAKLRAASADAPLGVDASFELASGGRARAEGSVGLTGEIDLDLELEEVALAPATSYLGDGSQLAGSVSGSLRLAGPARNPDRIEAKLALRDADVRLGEIALRGPLRVEIELAGVAGERSGRFDVEASEAELGYGRALRKPAGTPATMSGRIVSAEGGLLGFDDLKLRVRNLDASVEMSGGERMRMELETRPLALAGWEALLPALAGWRLDGGVAPQGVALEPSPTALYGRIELDGVQAVSPRGGTLLLRGALVGEGARVRSEGLELLAEGQPFRVDAELAELGGPSARWLLRFDAQGVELGRLLDGFADPKSSVSGRLTTDGELALPLDSGDALESLTGRVRFALRDGRTSGKSLLATSLEALIAVARPLHLLRRGFDVKGKRDADRFESVTGTFEIAGGFARTRDLRIIEREHSIDLAGTMRLSDLALDMRGKLTFADARDDEPGGVRQGIPLAHVGGTLGDPRVEVSSDAARSFAAALDPSRLGAKLERAISPESARELADGLGNLIDKAARKRR
jgi:uncharacterized protein involved in outer membrane biogenesis